MALAIANGMYALDTSGGEMTAATANALTIDGIPSEKLWLRADTLRAPDYQRAFKLGWAKRIAREFDPDKLRSLIVSRRSDGDYVLDGQHRLYAIRDILGWPETTVPCEVLRGLTLAQETKIFATQGPNGRKPITVLDEMHALYIGGDEEVRAIVATVERAGLRLDWGSGPDDGAVRCAATLRKLHRTFGSARLLETLSLLRDTFGTSSRVWQHEMLIGMIGFLARYEANEHYTRAEFVRKMSQIGLDGVLQKAAAIGVALGTGGWSAVLVGRALLFWYNYRRSAHQLPEWQEIVRPKEAEAERAERMSVYQKTYPRLPNEKR